MSQERLSKVNRRANSIALGMVVISVESLIHVIDETLNVRGNGYWRAERDELRAEVKVIKQALRNILEINRDVKRSIGFK